MMVKVIGLGAGGHAKVVIEILSLNQEVEVVGLLDPRENLWGTSVAGVPVLGGDPMFNEMYENGIRHIFIGVGAVGNTRPRQRLYELIRSSGFQAVSAIDRRAIISSSAEVGSGATIMPGVIINAEVRLGENVIVNSGAIIEHDCEIGDHVHVATGARLAGTVRVAAGAHIGVGATVKQCINIGKDAIVGAGAVVVNDVAAGTTVVGVPARPLNQKGR
jgi:sugar O-acyltransferase (sialic acid O-acetyltransferase NeuD family)